MVGGARRRRRVCFATCTRWATAVAVTPWQGEAAGFSGGMDKDFLSRLALVVAFAADNLYTSFSLWSLEALSNDTVIDPPTIKKNVRHHVSARCRIWCRRKRGSPSSTAETREESESSHNIRRCPVPDRLLAPSFFFLNRTTKNSDGNISTARDAAPPRAEDIWLARARASFCALRTQARASAPATRRARAAGMAKGSCKGAGINCVRARILAPKKTSFF